MFGLGSALDRMGLYRPIRRTVDYLSDPVRRRRLREIQEDFSRTRKDVAGWSRTKSDDTDPNRIVVIQAFTNLPLYAKWACLLAKCAQLEGLTPLILTFSGCRQARQYYSLFGIDQIVNWDEWTARAVGDDGTVTHRHHAMLEDAATVGEVMKLRYGGVDVGKHALSMTCRRMVQGHLNLTDRATYDLLQDQLSRAICSTIAAQEFFETYTPELLLVRDSGYIPNGGIFEVALQQEIDCILYEQGHRAGTWVLKRYNQNNKGEHYFGLSEETWHAVKALPWSATDEARVEREFAGRYQPESVDDTRRLMSGKRLKTPSEVRQELGLRPEKRTAVIFSHIAWDAAFFFGTCLFDDFEDWLYQTVKFVSTECPNVNWIVKLHPFNAIKLQREEKKEESEIALLQDLIPLPDHVRVVRAGTDISTQSLFPMVDYVLTVNGTVGMEFPCFGVPAIVAGTGRYSGRGFTIDPTSKDEYFSILKSIESIERLGDEETHLARRYFHAVSLGRQTDFQDVAPMELKKAHEGQSDVHNNLHFQSRSIDEFATACSIRAARQWMFFSKSPDLLTLPD